MRIAIFGSWHEDQVQELKDSPLTGSFADFQNCCRRLGREIATRKHTFLVASDFAGTAERYVVQGAVGAPDFCRGGAIVEVFDRKDTYFFKEYEDACAQGPQRTKPTSSRQPFRRDPRRPFERARSTHLRLLSGADAAIFIGGGERVLNAGLATSLTNVVFLPIGAFGGAGKQLLQDLADLRLNHIGRLPSSQLAQELNGNWQQTVDAIMETVDGFPRIMIVHGRQSDYQELKKLLGQRFNLREPIVLPDESSPGQTITAKFIDSARNADGAIAVFTADDVAAAKYDPLGHEQSPGAQEYRSRVRQNVALEYGWFWGQLGGTRILVLVKGNDGAFEWPSDIGNLDYVRFDSSIDECADKIREFIYGLGWRQRASLEPN